MKKLLSTVLALSMGATCVLGLTACGKKDAETAEKAISTVKSLYEDKGPTINEDYKLIGQTKVDDSTYPVSWTVSSETFSDLDKYVKVGEMDETTKLVTVSVAKADQAIEYQLTATVKVGKKSASATFDRKVSAKAKDAAGTKDDPFSPSRVLEIGQTIEPGNYYGGSDNPTLVYVKGFVVDPGQELNSTRVSYVYIVDEYAEDKDSNSDDALEIFSITYDDTYIKQLGDLAKGDEIEVSGFIQHYKNNNTGATKIEISYKGDVNVTCVAKKDARTDEQKVNDALAGVKATLSVSKAGAFTLPTSSVSDVAFTWSTENTTYTVDSTGKTLNVTALPTDEAATVTLTVTASLGSVSKTKSVTATIQKFVPRTEGAVNLDFSFDKIGDKDANEKSWGGYGDYVVAFENDDVTVSFSRASKQGSNQQITDVPVVAANNSTEYVTIALGSGTIGSVEFSLRQWTTKTFDNIHIEYFNGTAWVKCSDIITTPAKIASNATLPAGVQYVRLSVQTATAQNTQVGVESATIEVDPEGTSSLNPPTGNEAGDNSGTANPPSSGDSGTTTTNYGTLANPLSVTEALALAATECPNDKDVTKQLVYMTGVVTAIGETGSYYKNVYFGDLSNNSTTILAYTINMRTGVTAPVVGDVVVISGYIKNYQGTIEFATNGSTYAYFEKNNGH